MNQPTNPNKKPMVFVALTLSGLALSVPNIASAQRAVELIPLESYKLMSADGIEEGSTKLHLPARESLPARRASASAGIIYADPSSIQYAQVLPGATLAAPSSPDIQVNDPSLDNIQYPPGSDPYPWELATESETTLAADGQNIVVSYNSSANLQVVKVTGNDNGTIYYANIRRSAYSVSHDGGATWTSGFISPPQADQNTGGDGCGHNRSGRQFLLCQFSRRRGHCQSDCRQVH